MIPVTEKSIIGKSSNSKNELLALDKMDVTKTSDFMTLGLMAIFAGVIGQKIFNITDISYLLYGAGVLSCGYHSITNQKQHKKLWINTALVNKDGAMPSLIRKVKRDFGYDMVFSLPTGLSTKDFESKKEAIEQYFDKRINIDYSNKNLIISVHEKELQKEYPYEVIESNKITEIITGYSLKGKIELIDLADCPHVLIAGESGSGKSTILRSILTTMVLTKKTKDLELHLIDLKRGAEFNIFKKCEIVKSFSRTTEEALKELKIISKEIDRRYDLFYEKDCVDIKEYNTKFKNRKLKYKVIVIDEFADMQDEEEGLRIIEELSAKARACGIHMIIATQRPDAKILNGRIKANISTVIGLKTMNSINSRIIIDQDGLEKLRGKGHGILVYKGHTEIQAMNLSPEQARDLLRPYYLKEDNVIQLKKKESDKVGEIKDFGFLKGLVGGKK